MPRCASAVSISTPSGPASSTTAFFTSLSFSLSSMPRRMFLTNVIPSRSFPGTSGRR